MTASSPLGLTDTVGSLPGPTVDSRTDGAGRADGLGVGEGVGGSVETGGVVDGTGVGEAGEKVGGSTLVVGEPGGPAVRDGAGDTSAPQAEAARRVARANVATRPVRTSYSFSVPATVRARDTTTARGEGRRGAATMAAERPERT